MKKTLHIAVVIVLLGAVAVLAQSLITTEYDAEPSWQLVGGFDVNTIEQASSVQQGDINAVYALDPTQQTYIRMYPNPETAKIAAAGPALRRSGMWVHSSTSGLLQYGQPFPQQVAGTSLADGYTLYSLNDLTDIGESLNAHRGNCNFTHVWEYDSLRQIWESVPTVLDHVPVDPDDRGRVILLWLASDCTLN